MPHPQGVTELSLLRKASPPQQAPSPFQISRHYFPSACFRPGTSIYVILVNLPCSPKVFIVKALLALQPRGNQGSDRCRDLPWVQHIYQGLLGPTSMSTAFSPATPHQLLPRSLEKTRALSRQRLSSGRGAVVPHNLHNCSSR